MSVPSTNNIQQDIQPGDRVRVGGRVGDVIRVETIGTFIQYTIFFKGERPRPILVPSNVVEKVSDPLSQAQVVQSLLIRIMVRDSLCYNYSMSCCPLT